MSSAAAAPPPLIPISTSQTAASAGGASAPASSPAVRLLLSRLVSSLRRSLANRRPWSELLDRSAFSRPQSLSESAARVRRNVQYFRTNYALLLAAALAFSLFSHPFSLLLLLSLLAAWCFIYLFRSQESPLVLLGRQFSDRETLGGLMLLTVFVVFLTSVGSLLISALMVGATVVCAHGAFRVPEDLFMEYEEPAGSGGGGGFLSFLGGAAASAAAASAGPAMAGRV